MLLCGRRCLHVTGGWHQPSSVSVVTHLFLRHPYVDGGGRPVPGVAAVPDIAAVPGVAAIPGITAVPGVAPIPDVAAVPHVAAVPGVATVPHVSAVPGVAVGVHQVVVAACVLVGVTAVVLRPRQVGGDIQPLVGAACGSAVDSVVGIYYTRSLLEDRVGQVALGILRRAALDISRHLTSSGVSPGFCFSISAATPLVTAVACEVPDMVK